jgi:hypothetical protein
MRTLKGTLQIGFLSLLTAPLAAPAPVSQVSLQLLSARDHIDGSFTTSQAIYADKNYIYLASWQGRLFILERNRTANFPMIERIQVSSAPLTAVSGDGTYIYVSSSDGALRIYQNRTPFLQVNSIPLFDCGLASVSVIPPPPAKGHQQQAPEKLYVATGQTSLATSGSRLYWSALNSGEGTLQLNSQSFSVAGTYSPPFQQNTTLAFDAATGAQVGAVPNPLDLYGRLSQVSIYADFSIMVQTTPGCCGQGIVIRDGTSLGILQTIPRWFTNTVRRKGQWLLAGSESGEVDIFDLSQNPSPQVSSAGLRQLTGHTGAEDIEIRSLWTDAVDGLIFAASSWGNSQSQDLFLPSFFVLQLAQGKH